MKKILVLTSGGDAPGMNAAIRAVVMSSIHYGYTVFGAVSGYTGVINGDFINLNLKDVENIISLGGTVLKSSRCPEFLTKKGFNEAVKNIKKNAFDCVVVLGGDGSMRGASKLYEAGINTIVIPCTIDNDMSYTNKTIGFDTALNTITNLLGNVRDTSSSHDRVCVVEVMGRNSGELALFAGTAVGAEVILVPEIKTQKKDLMNKIKKSITEGEKCVLVVVSEGASSAETVRDEIKNALKIDVRAMNLGYVQRGGSPSTMDRVLATSMGFKAVELVKNETFGVAILDNGSGVDCLPYNEALEKNSNFNTRLFEINNILSV